MTMSKTLTRINPRIILVDLVTFFDPEAPDSVAIEVFETSALSVDPNQDSGSLIPHFLQHQNRIFSYRSIK